MGPQEGLLGGRFEVAEQEQGQPRAAHQQGDARVVGPLGRGPGRWRPEHLPLERPGPAPLTLHRLDDRHTGSRRGPPDELGLPRRIFECGGLDHTHGPAPQHPRQTSYVVGVKVRQQEQRDAVHAQGAQALVHRSGLRAGVHHQGLSRADGERSGVPLPHGALDVAPVGRRPAGERTGELRRPQYGQEQQCRQGGAEQPAPAEPGTDDHGDGQGGGGQQNAAGEPARPRQLRARKPGPGPGHARDPPRRHPRTTGEQLRGGHPHRSHRERAEAEYRRGTGRQLGQQVARHRHQADSGGQHGHHGRAHGLRGRCRPQRLGEPRPRPTAPQGFAPPRSEGEQCPGGQHGEQEAVAAGQPRVVEHQQQHGRAQGRDQ